MKKHRLDELIQAWKQQSPFKDDCYQKNLTTCVYEERLLNLQKNYTQLHVEKLTTTFGGNSIFALHIGNGPIRLQISAGMHANESINTNLLMAFISKMLLILQQENGSVLQNFFQHFTFTFVPLVNPDGLDLLYAPEQLPDSVYQNALRINGNQTDFSCWKANARGVDINNQFPAKWQKIFSLPNKCQQPAPRDFPGFAPLTEQESIAMYDLCMQYDFDSILCLHTQGEEFYWGFSEREPANSVVFAELYEAVTGYKGVRTLMSYGGLKDWFILHDGKLGVTVEIGLGINPLPITDFDSLIQKMDQIMFGYLFFYV